MFAVSPSLFARKIWAPKVADWLLYLTEVRWWTAEKGIRNFCGCMILQPQTLFICLTNVYLFSILPRIDFHFFSIRFEDERSANVFICVFYSVCISFNYVTQTEPKQTVSIEMVKWSSWRIPARAKESEKLWALLQHLRNYGLLLSDNRFPATVANK